MRQQAEQRNVERALPPRIAVCREKRVQTKQTAVGLEAAKITNLSESDISRNPVSQRYVDSVTRNQVPC